jgi:hypothetical protein
LSNGAQDPQLVLEIMAIDTIRKESDSPWVKSTVYGTVPTTGWVQPRLAPYTYVQPTRMASTSLISWPSLPKTGRPR